MKMANDTKAIATKYLPAACIKVGDMEIPARIIIMPGVNYDLLLGKDFLTATRATIGMDEDAAKATLTWNGQKQTFSLTDDIGEYGLVGEVTEGDQEFDMIQEVEQVINPKVTVSRRPGIIESCVCRVTTAWQGLFGAKTIQGQPPQQHMALWPKERDAGRKRRTDKSNNPRFIEYTSAHPSMDTQSNTSTTKHAGAAPAVTRRMGHQSSRGRGKKTGSHRHEARRTDHGYPGAQNWKEELKMSTKRTGGQSARATRFRNVQDRQTQGNKRASRWTTSATAGWRPNPQKATKIRGGQEKEGPPASEQDPARKNPGNGNCRKPVRAGQEGTQPEVTKVDRTKWLSALDSSESEASGRSAGRDKRRHFKSN